MMLKHILFITSFIPVIAFKAVARVGEATLNQAKMATVIGLILAGIQFIASRQFLKSTTYLDKAFLGFLGFGTAWIYFAPPPLSSLFVDHSITLLYSVLFLTTLLPQLFGYDPFTYAIAKQWYPETVWNAPQFRIINLHITYVWSCLFFFSALSSWLGHEKPVFSILIPLILLFGIGLPFSRKYPDYYLKRTFTTQPADSSFFPRGKMEDMRLLLRGMAATFNPQAAGNLKATIQFEVTGKQPGKWFFSIENRRCSYHEGKADSPNLTIQTPSEVWLAFSNNELDAQQAFIDGKYSVQGDIGLLMRMKNLFGNAK